MLASLLTHTVTSLDAAGIPDEALATLTQGKGFGPFRSGPAMVPFGRAWRLGVLLLDRSGGLYATGRITRAVESGWVTNQNAAQEVRRSWKVAASKGPFETGEVVNFDVVPLALDEDSLLAGSGPLSLQGGTVLVRWSASGQPARLEDYLADRISVMRSERD